MASGIPSRRRQISTTSGAVTVSSSKEGSAALARATKRATAGISASSSSTNSEPSRLLGPGRQRVHRPEPFAGHGQRFPAGGHNRDGGRLAEDPRHQLGHRLDQVLTVVENQQAVPGAQQIDDGIVDRARLPQVDVDGRGQRSRRGILIHDADQLHDMDAVLELVADGSGQLHRQRGLSDPTRTHQRDQPVIADHLAQLIEQYLAADQRLHTDADRGPCRPAGATSDRPVAGRRSSRSSSTVATNS